MTQSKKPTDTTSTASKKSAFVVDIAAIRKRARSHMDKGAVTEDYRADRHAILDILNTALATEMVCVLRYRQNAFVAKGLRAEPVVAEFLEHAADEQDHADRLATRIVQLGGVPNLSPQEIASRSHSEYVSGDNLVQMLRENLVAERIAIETYRDAVQYIGDDDPTTRRLLEDILAKEEEHADELASLLQDS